MSHPVPAKALESHMAILGKTGSGKTWAAKTMAESLMDAEGRVCIVDPTGAWYGLRTLADGRRAGYPVAIFGGSHADFPLQQHHGEELAEIIGTSATPAILDVSHLRTGERTRLFTDFAEGLLRKNRGPLHLIIDEAHLFAPQGRVNDPQSGAMLHAANNMVSLGRSRGLRIALITQRPAKLHKDSLTQVETLVAMRLIAPQDRKAVEEWIKDNADDAQGRSVLSSLATLKTGEGWVWAPEQGVLERVRFPKIRTFDSGRAPDGSEIEGRVLAQIDRDAISARLRAVAAEAEANDPKKLRAQLAEMSKKLASLEATKMDMPAPKVERVEVPIFKDEDYQRMEAIGQQLMIAAEQFRETVLSARRLALEARERQPSVPLQPRQREAYVPPKPVQRQVPVSPASRASNGSASLSKAERLVLTALAQYPHGRTKNQVAVLSGYAVNGGGFNNAISSCRTQGFLEGSGDRLQITPAGLAALGPYDPLPHGDALLRHWYGQLGKAERAALEALVAAYPRSLSKDDTAARAGYEPNGGGFNNALSRLRTLELIEGRGELRASEDLFG